MADLRFLFYGHQLHLLLCIVLGFVLNCGARIAGVRVQLHLESEDDYKRDGTSRWN